MVLFSASLDFNPRSPHGERLIRTTTIQAKEAYFNPRSPHGERPTKTCPITLWTAISIHAPRTGSDLWLHSRARTLLYFNPRSPHGERRLLPTCGRSCLYFNPRSPHGERLLALRRFALNPRFQSTLPARGATMTSSRSDGASAISIHAPRTGSDVPAGCCTTISVKFQSTLPARGATPLMCYHFRRRKGISIHAPRTGSDRSRKFCLRFGSHFNPRSPHGERQ